LRPPFIPRSGRRERSARAVVGRRRNSRRSRIWTFVLGVTKRISGLVHRSGSAFTVIVVVVAIGEDYPRGAAILNSLLGVAPTSNGGGGDSPAPAGRISAKSSRPRG